MPSVLKKVEIVAEWKDIQVGMEGIGSALIREVLSRSSNYCVSQKKQKKPQIVSLVIYHKKNPSKKQKNTSIEEILSFCFWD